MLKRDYAGLAKVERGFQGFPGVSTFGPVKREISNVEAGLRGIDKS